MKLDLKHIKNQLSEYHVQVAEIFSGIDVELEKQKVELGKIKSIEIELLRIMDRLDKIEKKLEQS